MFVDQETINDDPQAPRTPINVLDFGVDVRMMIYKMAFGNDAILITLRVRWQGPLRGEPQPTHERRLGMKDFSIRKPFFDADETPQRAPNLDLLYVNKQIRSEALPLFYGSFAFSFFQPELLEPFLKALPAQHRSYIRHIALDLGVHWRRPVLPNAFDRNRGITPRLDRFMHQTGIAGKEYHRMFTPDALEEEWKGTFMLMPNLHLLEARLWSWPNPGVRFLEPDSVNHVRHIHHQINNMLDFKYRLEANPEVDHPEHLLDAEAELRWQFSTSRCAGYSLPSALVFLDFGGYGTVSPNIQHGTKVGIACLNISLRNKRIKAERPLHLGDADTVASTLDMIEQNEAYRVFKGMTSWG